jgi:hypothetical protein
VGGGGCWWLSARGGRQLAWPLPGGRGAEGPRPPAPARGPHLRGQDADGHGELEHDVERAARLVGRHLRQVQGSGLGARRGAPREGGVRGGARSSGSARGGRGPAVWAKFFAFLLAVGTQARLASASE